MYNQPLHEPQLQVVSLNFVETGTYNPMYLRPYETHASNDSFRQIEEVTQGGQRVDATALAGVAGSFLRPVANAGARIDIQNGWEQKRLRFIMELHYPAMHGGRLIQYVSGWTNHVGVARSNALDPMMTLHFNESILMQEFTENTPLGLTTARRIVSAAQILSQGNYQNFQGGSFAGGIRTMRPEDVFSDVGARMTYGHGSQSGGGMVDLRQGFLVNNDLKKSRRSNGSASQYLARAISSHNQSIAEVEYDASAEEIAHKTSSLAREDSIAKDNFLAWLKEKGLLNAGGSLTWGELCRVAPGADHVARAFIGGEAQEMMLAPSHTAGNSYEWNGAGTETIFATILGQSVPAAMMDCMITKAYFKASNRFHDPFGIQGNNTTHHVALIDYGSIVMGAGLAEFAAAFIRMLQTRILPDVSMSGMIDYDLKAMIDVFGESRFSISVGGAPHKEFVIPSFCDNLVVPVVTSNPNALTQMSSDVQFLLSNIQRAQSVTAPQSIISSPYGF